MYDTLGIFEGNSLVLFNRVFDGDFDGDLLGLTVGDFEVHFLGCLMA